MDFLCGGGAVPPVAVLEQPILLVVELGDLVVDLAVEPRAGELDRPADRVLDGPGVGAAVADETAAVDPEQGGGAVLAVVGALAEAVDGRLGQHVPHLGARGALDLLADHAKEHGGQRRGRRRAGARARWPAWPARTPSWCAGCARPPRGSCERACRPAPRRS